MYKENDFVEKYVRMSDDAMQTSLTTIESRQSLAENELSEMRSNLRDYELLVDDYRTQVCINS